MISSAILCKLIRSYPLQCWETLFHFQFSSLPDVHIEYNGGSMSRQYGKFALHFSSWPQITFNLSNHSSKSTDDTFASNKIPLQTSYCRTTSLIVPFFSDTSIRSVSFSTDVPISMVIINAHEGKNLHRGEKSIASHYWQEYWQPEKWLRLFFYAQVHGFTVGINVCILIYKVYALCTQLRSFDLCGYPEIKYPSWVTYWKKV